MGVNAESDVRAWLERWRVAGAWLEAERLRELASLTPAAGRRAAADMLDLGARAAGDPAREASSGFVIMRALFARLDSTMTRESPARRGN